MNGMAGKFRDAAISTLNLNEKLRVIYVISGSPAEKAEIQPGDIILGMNGQEAPTGADARKAFRKFIKQTKGDIHISMEGTSGVRQVTMSPLQSCDYGVELVEDEKINAHAGLTSIAVTRGMLRYADDDNELALVVSHELAHVAMGHVEKTLERATGGFLVDMVFAVVLGVDTQGFFTKTAAKIYSKEQEAEADYVGLYLMARAGYEFRDAANFWRRMAMISPGSIGEGHWATHPSTAKRFAAIKKTVDEIKAKKDAGLPLAPKFRRSPLKRDTNDSL
jgi:predicted Zn-dependent protease